MVFLECNEPLCARSSRHYNGYVYSSIWVCQHHATDQQKIIYKFVLEGYAEPHKVPAEVHRTGWDNVTLPPYPRVYLWKDTNILVMFWRNKWTISHPKLKINNKFNTALEAMSLVETTMR